MPIFLVSTEIEGGSETPAEAKILENEVILGRKFLIFECSDNRISRSHGILQLEDLNGDFVKIKSTHTNPIFYKINGEDETKTLLSETEITLKHDDQFGLLPDKFWYKISIRTIEENFRPESLLRVRGLAELNNSQNFPVILPEVSNGCPPICDSQQETLQSSTTPDSSETVQNQAVESSNVKREPESPTDYPTSTKRLRTDFSESSNTATLPQASSDTNIQPSTSSSQQMPIATTEPKLTVKKEEPDSSTSRPSCEHGINCYRHTADHRAEFAHPSDTDYRRPNYPPAPPGTPQCPYGARCYRRNPIHFVQYAHPPSTKNDSPPSTAPNAPAWLPRPLRQPKNEPNDRDSDLDESDDEDFNGSSSDEYLLLDPGSDESDESSGNDSAILDEGVRNED